MKLLHLADLHLGKSLSEYDLAQDQRFILDQILDIIDEKKIDGVLMAGDIYDKAIPSEAATRLLDYFLKQLSDRGVSTFVISGNHDSDDRLNYGSSLFESNHIFIYSVFDGRLKKCTFKAPNQEVEIYMLPFVKASQVRHYFPDADINSYEDAVKTIIENSQIDENKVNILIAHQFVAGKGADPTLGGSEGASTQSVGTVEKIGYGVFDKFDYVALGHIHSPQQVGREEIRYAGSPLKYSLSEVNNEKSLPMINIDENGRLDIELLPLKPMRDLRHIRGKLKDLLDSNHVTDTGDFIYATLTDEDIIPDAMGIFQQIYPNTVKIDYDNSHTKDIFQIDITKITQNKSYEDLIGEFYAMIYGCEITDEEMEVMKATAREAGVLNEAN